MPFKLFMGFIDKSLLVGFMIKNITQVENWYMYFYFFLSVHVPLPTDKCFCQGSAIPEGMREISLSWGSVRFSLCRPLTV